MGRVVSAARFYVWLQGWSTGLGFSELSGFNSTVEHQEYSYNSLLGNVHTKQFGRAKPPSIALKRGLDAEGFAQMFAWHALARVNNPLAKSTALLTIMDASGETEISCVMENAWCARLEIDSVQAGAGNVTHMKVTIECDNLLPASVPVDGLPLDGVAPPVPSIGAPSVPMVGL